MERIELINPRDVVRSLFKQHMDEASEEKEFDPISYFEKNVSWDEVRW